MQFATNIFEQVYSSLSIGDGTNGLKSLLVMIKLNLSINGLNLTFIRVLESGAGVKKKN